MPPVSNPVELVSWAIATGRIEAADEALWLARVTGPGAQAYVDELLDAQVGRTVTLPE